MDNPYIRRYPDASPAASQQPVARKSSLELIHWDDSISNNSINEKASTASDSSSVPPLAQRPLSTISPYIGLGAKLSRAWATHTVVLLLLTAIMFIFNGLEAKEKAQHAIQRLHDGCMNVQTATETVVNLPETMAKGTIKTIEKSTQSLVRMTGKSLISLLDALEKLVVWIIKMYFGTIICIAEVIIRSALDVVADAGKVLTDIANKVINGLIGGLQKAGEGAAKALEGAANGLGGIIGSITGKEAPKIDLLKDIGTKDFSIKIPDEWVNKIKDISAKIPTEDEIFGNLTKVLDKPFGFLKTQISDSFSKVKVNITGKVDFPKKKHIEMCKEGLGKDTINALADVAAKIMYIAAIILIIIAIGIVVSQCLLILRQHRGFQKRLADFRQDLVDYLPVRDAVQRRQQKVTREEMDLFMLPGNSVLNTTTRFINSRFGHSEKVSLWRWYFHYIWHPPSLACFVAGFTGLLCILAQIHAINSLRGTYVPRLARDIDRFDHDYFGGKILGK
ncbi:plasma membrane fusion protein prm1, partial [Dipsacomyces acuminosporus]